MTLHEIAIKRVKWATKDLRIGLTPRNCHELQFDPLGVVILKLKIDELELQVKNIFNLTHHQMEKYNSAEEYIQVI